MTNMNASQSITKIETLTAQQERELAEYREIEPWDLGGRSRARIRLPVENGAPCAGLKSLVSGTWACIMTAR